MQLQERESPLAQPWTNNATNVNVSALPSSAAPAQVLRNRSPRPTAISHGHSQAGQRMPPGLRENGETVDRLLKLVQMKQLARRDKKEKAPHPQPEQEQTETDDFFL